MKIHCPNCPEGREFTVIAHVTQEWCVDAHGEFIEAITDYLEVTHRPDRDDRFTCTTCGGDAIVEED